jgi:hypothetical protein
MEIKFDTTIDDLAEHHFRLFIRSKTYKKNRWFGAVGSFLGVGAVFLILKNYSNAEFPLWFPLLLGGIGAIVYLVFYPDIMKKNIKNYHAKKIKDGLPCTTTYKIKDGHIICNSLNKDDVSFKISDLVNVKENEKLIELSFGPKVLWVIPKRAFESSDEIDQFKNILKSEQANAVDR